MTEATPDARQLMERYTRMWNEQDFEKLPELVTESITVYNPNLPEGKTRGRDGLKEWAREVRTGFPDFRVEVLDLLAEGDTVMAEVKYHMTHEGEFGDIPPTGREAEIQAMAKFRLEDGKIAEHRDYVNQQELLDQLGVTEA